jgi:hypothetical protein
LLVFHEAIESISRLDLIEPEALQAWEFLEMIKAQRPHELVNHPDIVATFARAKRQLVDKWNAASNNDNFLIQAEEIVPHTPSLDSFTYRWKIRSRIGSILWVLLYHPDPIVRHEASFIIWQEGTRYWVSALRRTIRKEVSIIALHEAIEAMGVITQLPTTAQRNIDFLESVRNDPKKWELFEQKDIQGTLARTLWQLEKIINSPIQ